MGRMFVILLAAAFTMVILISFIPGLYDVAFHVKGYGIKWAVLVGLGTIYGYHRLTGK